ncbi:MAG TPA: hypothetical protein VGO52_01700, partial [Hyphomonadaceae bacterium]|nr:hypothetical protein [Hyphomonadaceae bacterium]
QQLKAATREPARESVRCRQVGRSRSSARAIRSPGDVQQHCALSQRSGAAIRRDRWARSSNLAKALHQRSVSIPFRFVDPGQHCI